MKPILTAGYGDRGFARFVELLKANGVTHLVDVRSVPSSSYWEEFRRANLERLVPETDLRYVYMGDTLGGVKGSATLCKEPGKVALEPLMEQSEFQRGLDRLIEAAETRDLCLMCGCKEPRRCHRSRLIGVALLRRGLDLVHLDAKDRPVRQSELEGDLRTLF